MEQIWRDIRYALRRLRKTPGFTLFAVASLALGIGVCTAIYSAVRTLLWMLLGIPDAAGLIVVASDPRVSYPALSWPDFQDFRSTRTAARAVAAGVMLRTTLRAGEVSQTVFGEAVSGQFFAVMSLRPRLGRLLDANDEAAAARVAVLSEGFWRTRLHSDPDVVGRTIGVGGHPFEVVGVIAGTFRGLEPVRAESVWLPVTAIAADAQAFSLDPTLLTRRAGASFGVWARLEPDVPLSRLNAEAALVAQRLNRAYPPETGRPERAWTVRSHDDDVRRGSEFVRTVVIAILVAIGVVLFIACTNLANLALARGTERAQETAVRTALGASRWRLVREQLIETMIVVAGGDALSVVVLQRLVGYFSTDLPIGPGITIPFRPEIDTSVLTAALLATLIALVVFGLWPAFASTRADADEMALPSQPDRVAGQRIRRAAAGRGDVRADSHLRSELVGAGPLRRPGRRASGPGAQRARRTARTTDCRGDPGGPARATGSRARRRVEWYAVDVVWCAAAGDDAARTVRAGPPARQTCGGRRGHDRLPGCDEHPQHARARVHGPR